MNAPGDATRARTLTVILAALTIAVTFAQPDPLSAQAGQARLTLIVTAEDSGEPLAGARVTVGSTGRTGMTNARGLVLVAGIPAGVHWVEISQFGYAAERAAIEFAVGAAVQMDAALAVAPFEMEGVEVSTTRSERRLRLQGFYSRQKSSGGVFLDRTEIDKLPPYLDAVELFRRVRGFRLIPKPTGSGYTLASSRGAVSINGSCEPTVWVDGMPFGEHMLDFLAVMHIEAIEAYQGPGTTPPQFLAGDGGGSCGTVVVWTRLRG